MFRKFEAFNEQPTFQQTCNSALRHLWTFLKNTDADEEIIVNVETLFYDPDILAMFDWIFELTTEKPESIDKLSSNPFSSDFNAFHANPENCDVNNAKGIKMSKSYIIQLRIFYRWISKEIFVMLR